MMTCKFKRAARRSGLLTLLVAGIFGTFNWPPARAENIVAPSGIERAAEFPGSDACAQIQNAINAAIAQGGGIVDARAFHGRQVCAAGITVGGSTSHGSQNVLLEVGNATFFLPSIVVNNNSSIVGPYQARSATIYPPANFVESPGANSNPFIRFATVQGSGEAEPLLENLVIDGNCRTWSPRSFPGAGTCKNPTEGPGMIAGLVILRHVQFRDFAADGIYVTSGNSDAWIDVESYFNGGDGLHLVHASDLFITESQFEANHRYGIETTNSPTLRLTHSDVGGNTEGGWYDSETAAGPWSGRQIVIGNQFGNNNGNDISWVGYDASARRYTSDGWVIVGNSFIGSDSRTNNTYSAINIQDSMGNVIVGNYFECGGLHNYNYAVNIHESAPGREGQDTVVGNSILGRCGTAQARGVPSTLWSSNAGFPVVSVGGGASWTAGAGAPSGSCTNGSLYSNTQGRRRSTLYDCVSGAWKDVN